MFINARNEHVTKGLQNAYASKVPDKKLEVFCVSNKMYGKYTRKGNSEIVNCSGIPSLRKFCHSITAEAQLREAKHFLQSSLFSLLNSLHIWACSSVMNIEDESFESREVYAQLEDVVSNCVYFQNPSTLIDLLKSENIVDSVDSRSQQRIQVVFRRASSQDARYDNQRRLANHD